MNNRFLFKNTTLIPMREGVTTQLADLLVEAGRIAQIGQNLPSDGAETIDGSGLYILPGLHDMHVHLKDSTSELLMYLASGVTTVRNMLGKPLYKDWRDQINASALHGPTIYTFSPIFEGKGVSAFPDNPGFLYLDDSKEARREVFRVKSEGYDFIKIYDLLSAEVFAAIAEASREAGLPFAGHVPKAVGLEKCIEAGQHTFEHMNFFSAEDIPVLAGAEAWVCPTVIVGVMGARIWYEDALPILEADPRTKYLTKSNYDTWAWACNFKNTADEALKAVWDITMAGGRLERTAPMVKEMFDRGVRLLTGTDTPVQFIYPGLGLHEELEFLVQCGIPELDVLKMATVNAAQCLGTEKDSGTIEIGKIADLLILDANPLEDIHNTTRIAGVMKTGDWYDRQALDGMLQEVQEIAKAAYLEQGQV